MESNSNNVKRFAHFVQGRKIIRVVMSSKWFTKSLALLHTSFLSLSCLVGKQADLEVMLAEVV